MLKSTLLEAEYRAERYSEYCTANKALCWKQQRVLCWKQRRYGGNKGLCWKQGIVLDTVDNSFLRQDRKQGAMGPAGTEIEKAGFCRNSGLALMRASLSV
jgi:hypothetical protein